LFVVLYSMKKNNI